MAIGRQKERLSFHRRWKVRSIAILEPFLSLALTLHRQIYMATRCPVGEAEELEWWNGDIVSCPYLERRAL